jgi:hypothetical protein
MASVGRVIMSKRPTRTDDTVLRATCHSLGIDVVEVLGYAVYRDCVVVVLCDGRKLHVEGVFDLAR